MMNKKQYVLSLFFTFIFRLVRIFPNNDPIMGFVLPQSRTSIVKSASFAFLAIFIFDFFSSGIGIWTWATASVYALLAVMFYFIFKNIKKTKISQYVLSGVVGVLIFDILTGPIMSTIIFNSPLWFTFLGQIPFTFYHLISATTYIVILTPIFDLDIREQYINYKNKIINEFIVLINFLRFF